MKTLLSRIRNELSAFFSVFKMLFGESSGERQLAKLHLLRRKIITVDAYVAMLKGKYSISIDSDDFYLRIAIGEDIFYWPKNANVKSLFGVLAESYLISHPHYYDSLPTRIEPGNVVLDVGACEGAFALNASKVAKKVIAVEPSKVMTTAMKLACKELNISNVDFVEGLIGAQNCQLGFIEKPDFPEASIVTDLHSASESRRCWTLSDFIFEFFPLGVDFIKCDAEGVDLDILISGKEALIKYRPKLAFASYHHQHHFKSMEQFLNSIGYTVVAQGVHYSYTERRCWPVLLKAYWR